MNKKSMNEKMNELIYEYHLIVHKIFDPGLQIDFPQPFSSHPKH